MEDMIDKKLFFAVEKKQVQIKVTEGIKFVMG
jgi:hypothetical protein